MISTFFLVFFRVQGYKKKKKQNWQLERRVKIILVLHILPIQPIIVHMYVHFIPSVYLFVCTQDGTPFIFFSSVFLLSVPAARSALAVHNYSTLSAVVWLKIDQHFFQTLFLQHQQDHFFLFDQYDEHTFQ